MLNLPLPVRSFRGGRPRTQAEREERVESIAFFSPFIFSDSSIGTTTAREVMELLRELHTDGQTIVMVTHDPRVAAQADRVLRMRDGQIAAESRLDAQSDRRRVLSELVELGA